MILSWAGRDGTEAYSEVHSPSLLVETLTRSKLKGTLDTSTVDASWSKSLSPAAAEDSRIQLRDEKPPLQTLLSSHDFEAVAEKTISRKAWAFYSSAATDLITARANKSFFDRMWFRPRVLRNVRTVDMRCELQGIPSSLPLFVSPTAMAKLVDRSGEKGVAAACASRGIIQCVSMDCTVHYALA